MTALAPSSPVPATVMGNFRFYEGTVCRVFLNDIPIFQGYEGDGFSHNGRLSHYLVPGVNRLALEILRAPLPADGRLEYRPDPSPQVAERDFNQAIEIAIFKERSPGTREIEFIHRLRFPDVWKDVEEERRRFPCMHVVEFDPEVSVPELAFLSSPRQEIPCEGTRELRDALTELHAAFVSRDPQRLADATKLQMAEFAQSHGGLDGSSHGDQLDAIRELCAGDIVVDDLDWAQIHFHGRAEGRVVHVERLDHAPVIMVKTRGLPQGHKSDPVFTFHQGRWQLM